MRCLHYRLVAVLLVQHNQNNSTDFGHTFSNECDQNLRFALEQCQKKLIALFVVAAQPQQQTTSQPF
jgi:hypothetical protein